MWSRWSSWYWCWWWKKRRRAIHSSSLLLLLTFQIFNASNGTYVESVGGGVVGGVGIATPRFLSRPTTFQAVTGDTVLLPCDVQNLGSFVVIWRRGTTILSAAQLLVTRDPRFSLAGHSLQLAAVRPEDQADYTCQIGDGSQGDLIHTLQILVPPTVQVSPTGGQATARQGGTVTFECAATGNPVAAVQWRRRDGGPLPPEEQGAAPARRPLTLRDVRREHAGVYQCSASNGIGREALAELRLHVLYPPEVTALRRWVNTGEGLDAKLQCSVRADPAAHVQWFQDSFPLEPTDRRTMSSEADAAGREAAAGRNTHTLTVRSVRASDLGNYSCLVTNSLGRERRYIELSGRPGPATVLSGPRAPHTRYNLTWSVQSVFDVPEVRILYRRVSLPTHHSNSSAFASSSSGRWHDAVVTPGAGRYDAATGDRRQWHVLRDLAPDSVYECLVQARNRHGWGDLSEVHQWFTARPGDHHPNAADDDDDAVTNAGRHNAPVIIVVALLLSFIAARPM